VTRFAVRHMAFVGEPKTDVPPRTYSVVPGPVPCSGVTYSAGRSPRTAGSVCTAVGTCIIATSALDADGVGLRAASSLRINPERVGIAVRRRHTDVLTQSRLPARDLYGLLALDGLLVQLARCCPTFSTIFTERVIDVIRTRVQPMRDLAPVRFNVGTVRHRRVEEKIHRTIWSHVYGRSRSRRRIKQRNRTIRDR